MFTITTSNKNADIPNGMSRQEAREHYLAMTRGFMSRFEGPKIERRGSRYIFRGDASALTLKGYAAEQLIATTPQRTLVYVATRAGMAPDAIAKLAKEYGKRCVFFSPACKELSVHQRALLAHGAELRFVRIVRMPQLNRYAARWARENDAAYLPPGLRDVPLVTAGLVRIGERIGARIAHDPTEVWMAISTGTAIRAFQIAWPRVRAVGLAVARNLQAGEIGEAEVTSATMPFLSTINPSEAPPFPCTLNYDAKFWRQFEENAPPGSIFINVGSDDLINQLYDEVRDVPVDSWREWRDLSDVTRPL